MFLHLSQLSFWYNHYHHNQHVILSYITPTETCYRYYKPEFSWCFTGPPNFFLLLFEIFQIYFWFLWELNALILSFKLISYFSMKRGNYALLILFTKGSVIGLLCFLNYRIVFVYLAFVVLLEFIHVPHESKVVPSLIRKRCPAEVSLLTSVLTVHVLVYQVAYAFTCIFW
jgi:hypothetical protein